MPGGGSVVGLDFDATVAWPKYDWMGVAKAAFESTARYLARDLGDRGIRVNLVAAGPIKTMAAKSIPGFEEFEAVWAAAGAPRAGTWRTPSRRRAPASRCCRTGSPPPPARSSTSTAGSTRWAARSADPRRAHLGAIGVDRRIGLRGPKERGRLGVPTRRAPVTAR